MKIVLLFALLASCAADAMPEPRCRRSAECDDAYCIGGRCQSDRGPQPSRDLGVDVPPSSQEVQPSLCADAVLPSPHTLALNEVLANVPAGVDGDANDDGVRDPYDDEFVEVVNTSPSTLDLTGVRVTSGGKLRHTFEPLCLRPWDSVVVFGGGSVGPRVTGNALVSDRRLMLSNEGGEVALLTPDGAIDSFEWGSAPAASFTRVPQLSGANWVSHLEISPLPFSPGRCPDGRPLVTRCPPE